MRLALRQVVNSADGMVCCGEADDANTTLAALRKLSPDLILLDYYLKAGDGIDLIKDIRRIARDVRILVISRFSDAALAERALRSGADGYIVKEEKVDQVVAAVRLTLQGENYLSSAISGQVVKRMLGLHGGGGVHNDELAHLSDREFQVLQFLGQGFANREIAARLGLSPKTIETYREKLKTKLGLADSQQLILFAARRFDSVSQPTAPTSRKSFGAAEKPRDK